MVKAVKRIMGKLLIENNIPYVMKNNGLYIASINGLTEFDNGPNSGWLYTVNGQKIDRTYDAVKISNGDTIKWYYTDDYTKEPGYENWDSEDAESSDFVISGNVQIKDNEAASVIKNDEIDKADEIKAAFPKESADNLHAQQ